jgi:hypothetical protein
MFPQQDDRLIQVCLIWCWIRVLCETLFTVFPPAVLNKNVVLLVEPQTVNLSNKKCLSVVGHWSIRDSHCGFHFTSHYKVTVTGFYQENPAISGDN